MEKRESSFSAGERNIGHLLVIGGNEDSDENDMKILPHFVEMCGGRSARIVICGTPSSEPAEKDSEAKNLRIEGM